MGILVSIIIGAIAGWAASMIMKSNSSGLLLNIILGILGGYVGPWLLNLLNVGFSSTWLGIFVTSTIGAIVLIFAARLLFGKK